MVPDLLDELPPPQRLAWSYAPSAARPATLALLALDTKFGAVVRKRGEPALAQLRLAWWRDTLQTEPREWPVGEAVLGLLREWRDPAKLVKLVDGWEALLGETLDPRAISEFKQGRAEGFAQLAHELGRDAEASGAAGGLWALGDLAANLSDPAERAAVIAAAGPELRVPVLPSRLRPLAVLSGLAQRSLARGGTPLLDGPRAALTAMRIGITGR